MAHHDYYNFAVGLNDMVYDSHKSLIEKITLELGCHDKFEYLCDKFLDQPKLKCKVDENAPKKPKSGFVLFCEEKRPKIMEKVKKACVKKKEKFNLGVVQKELGQMWTSLNEEEKHKYSELAEKDKERYQNEFEEYQEKLFGGIYQN